MLFQGEMRYTHFPYCLRELEDGRFILLNRRYKPLGISSGDHVVYEDSPTAMHIKGLDEKTTNQIDARPGYKDGHIYLYRDGTIPTSSTEAMDEYLVRLTKVMKLKTYSNE